ncbi:hypothetical protein QR680_011885 [Steinernema hermaphroditum]|uniref:Uncharacterized protein n=1 Tax=Steinernema hermaphroditum TaxID=289476 RepID=A0AA39I041_9BILA|nr:hypothetical protein QR680_011885 [Steinernema hermaphroditum]
MAPNLSYLPLDITFDVVDITPSQGILKICEALSEGSSWHFAADRNKLRALNEKYKDPRRNRLPKGDCTILFEIIDTWKKHPGPVYIHLELNGNPLPQIEGYKRKELFRGRAIYTCVVRGQRRGHCCFLEHNEHLGFVTIKCLM